MQETSARLQSCLFKSLSRHSDDEEQLCLFDASPFVHLKEGLPRIRAGQPVGTQSLL